MTPFQVYLMYLSLKNHFTKDSYDYYKYGKKTRATIQSFYKRKDRFFFERLSRQKEEKEIENFFISNFVSSSDSQSVWIGDMIKNGTQRYEVWKSKIDSLSDIFEKETKKLFENNDFKDIFNCSKGHPILLKKYLSNQISLETLVIYNYIFAYVNNFDKKLKDPIWEVISLKIKKYSSFLHVDLFNYRKKLKQIIESKT